MEWEREMASKFREGKAEGRTEQAIEDARSFYQNGASLELISTSLKMSIDEVREITKDIKRKWNQHIEMIIFQFLYADFIENSSQSLKLSQKTNKIRLLSI